MNPAHSDSDVIQAKSLPVSGRKTRITIRIDSEIIDWFKRQVEALGGGNYQTLLNQALRDYINRRDEALETVLRRVLREELRAPQSAPIRIRTTAARQIEAAPEGSTGSPPPPPPVRKKPMRWEAEQAWGG